MKSTLPDISYPALLWREGYLYLANTALDLCAHPRSLFADTVNRAKAGEWQLVDARGRCFQVVDWEPIKPFGGIKGVGMRLLRSVFAAPILGEESHLPLSDFKKKLTSAVRSRYRHDTNKSIATDVVKTLHRATSYEEAIASLPKL